ncbi:MAG: SH3 domain-containing protein, partial [Lachnospiraceae bacterium]|nr:SH3 domain-containing protein [Lachnospiraceae bacterium]
MRRFLKKAVAILSAGCIAAGLLAGCGSSGTTAAVNDQSSGQTTAEADHKAEVKLVSFAGKTLTVEYEGVEYTLDISKAIINTNVMHSGDTLLIYYDGELGDDPSKFSVISVENLDADKEDSEEIVGTLEEITMNSITIRLNDGRILTFNANNAEHSFSYGVDEGNWVTIIYDGELNGTDTTNLAVTKIHDEETEHTKRVKAQTVIEDVDDTVYVLENTYVRSSFMMASEVLGALPAGQEVKRTGRCNNGWDRIEYEGREAYVYGTLLTTNPNEVGVKQTTQNLSQKVKVKALSETVYVKSDANVRANYSTASASIGGLKAGTAVTRTGICDNGWSRIEYEGKDAYVYSDLLTTRNPNSEVDGVTITAVDETIYAVTDANVYESFSEDSEAIGTLKYGDHVVRTGICSNGWSRVICYNRDGYVRSDLISTTNPIQIVTVKIYVTDGWAWATTDANIRESFTVDSKAIGVLREGEKIKVTGYTDVNWTRVLYNGMTGYIHNDLLTTVSPEGPTA